LVTASVADLTPPEREVLTHVCQGKNDPEIGTELGGNRRSALIVWAREHGIGAEGVAAKPPKARKSGARKPSQLAQNNQEK
jgi:FixJ family two-component response regulator